MPSNIEKIRTAEAQIEVLEKSEADTRTEAMSDGNIDETEQADLDRIQGKINGVKTTVATLRQQFEENRRTWQSRASDYATFGSQLDEVQAWEAIECAQPGQHRNTIENAVAVEDYAQANLEIESALSSLTPIYEQYSNQKDAQANYDANWPAVSERVRAAASNTYEFLQTQRTAVETALQPVDDAVAAKDYIAADEVMSDLLSALTEFESASEKLEEKKAEYDASFAEISDRVAVFEASRPGWDYLEPHKTNLTTLTTRAGTESESGDYETAIATLAKITEELTVIDGLIEAKKADYDAAFSTFDGRLQTAFGVTYVDLGDTRDDLERLTVKIEEAAQAEDWVEAIAQVSAGESMLDAYEQSIKAQEELIKIIESRLPALKTTLGTFSAVSSSVKDSATARVSTIEAAVGGAGSLLDAVKDIDVLVIEMDELAEVKRVTDLLAAAAAGDKDDVAKTIVNDMKAAGTLDTLPSELRSTLVETLMDGTVEADEHAAIQEIFSMPHIDREFEELDAPVRQSIIDAYMKDPEIKTMSEDWATMTAAERTEAVKKLIKVPCGDEGWDVGEPANIVPYDQGVVDGRISYGGYSHPNDRMRFNTNDVAHADFGETLDTITHEIGHRHQRQMVDELNAGTLTQGHPNYEQARWLKQYFDYKTVDRTEAKKVYKTSPSETHSRQMGDEMKAGMTGGFEIPEDAGDGHEEHDH